MAWAGTWQLVRVNPPQGGFWKSLTILCVPGNSISWVFKGGDALGSMLWGTAL